MGLLDENPRTKLYKMDDKISQYSKVLKWRPNLKPLESIILSYSTLMYYMTK